MNRTDELTAKLLDGTLSDAEWAELECFILSDPALEKDHLALLDLESVLRGFRTEFDLSESTVRLIRSLRDETTTRAVMAEISGLGRPQWTPVRQRPRWLAAAGLAAIAAGLLLGVWLAARNDHPQAGTGDPDSPPAVARLTRFHGAVEILSPTGEVMAASQSSDVPAGHTLRTVGEDSLARVELPDRTTVDIEPDSVVRFLATGDARSKPKLFLAAGQLIAEVPEGSPGRQLVVGTGVAEVFSRTGTFVVSSAGPESARVDVKQGKVEVVRANAPTRVAVDRGSAFIRAGFDKVDLEPTVQVDIHPVRSLAFPGAKDAVFSLDGSEVWVASGRKFTRWTRDGGTADILFPGRKGTNPGPFVAFSRDRTRLATATFLVKEDRTGRDEKLAIRSLPGGVSLAEFPLQLSDPRLWTLAPDGGWLAVGEPRPNRRVHVLDGVSGAVRYTRDFTENVSGLTSSPDGTLLAVALSEIGRGSNSKIVLLSSATGERLATLPSQRKGMAMLAFSNDGRYLAAGYNGHVQLWDVPARELVRTITGFERVVTSLAFAPDGTGLAAGTQDGQVWIWSTATGRPVQLIEVGGRGVRSLAFSPDGKRLLTLANSVPVSLWNVADLTAPGPSN